MGVNDGDLRDSVRGASAWAHAAQPADTTPGVVTIWSDIGCPWATLAPLTLHRAATVFADLDVARAGADQSSPHLWTPDGPFAVNPGVDDVDDFTEYDAGWTDRLS